MRLDENSGSYVWRSVREYRLDLLATSQPLSLGAFLTHRGWVILVVVGIPLYILLEGLGEVFFSEKVGKSISDKDFSGVRILSMAW